MSRNKSLSCSARQHYNILLLSGKDPKFITPEEYLCYLGIRHNCCQESEACTLTPWSFTAIIWQPLPLKSDVLQDWGTFIFWIAFITSLVVSLLGLIQVRRLTKRKLYCNLWCCTVCIQLNLHNSMIGNSSKTLCLRLHLSLLYGC